MSRAATAFARLLARLHRMIPAEARQAQIKALLDAEARTGEPEEALSRLFRLSDDLARVIDERAVALGEGEHPRHRLTGYHDYFIARIPRGARVLELGCGRGTIARSIANRVPGSRVTGIDVDEELIGAARAGDNPRNVSFLYGESLFDLPYGRWDVVVLSNLLERLEDRVGFLRRVLRQLDPPLILVRVPLRERGWEVALRRELDLPYFADPAHVVEHSRADFLAEMRMAGLAVVEIETVWGEIRAACTSAEMPPMPEDTPSGPDGD